MNFLAALIDLEVVEGQSARIEVWDWEWHLRSCVIMQILFQGITMPLHKM